MISYHDEFFETCQFLADELGKDVEHIEELVALTGLNFVRELLRDLSITYMGDSFTYKHIGHESELWHKRKLEVLYEYLERSSLRYRGIAKPLQSDSL